MKTLKHTQQTDPEVYEHIVNELERQRDGLEMIPSENITSIEVLEAQGSILTNKYAEGYPGQRYYGGNEHVDKIEQLAIDRACQLFGAEYANVQPHSGSSANMAAFWAVLQPGDTILGMDLAHGGHLTHGYKLNFSGKLYNAVQYGVDEKTHLIDFDQVRTLAREHKPKLIIAGITAYSRQLDFEQFRKIADEVGALLLADISHISGLVAAGLHPSPVPLCDIVTSTTHKTLRGPRSGFILCKKELGKKIDKAIIPGLQGGPLEHVIAAKAIAFKQAMQPEFKEYMQAVLDNADTLAEELKKLGHTVISDGTENHMLLVDVRPCDIDGAQAEDMLDEAGIYCNKNTIPDETGSPLKPSGIRLGTPTLTTRGMGKDEMVLVAQLIDATLRKQNTVEIKAKVTELCNKFPIYSDSL